MCLMWWISYTLYGSIYVNIVNMYIIYAYVYIYILFISHSIYGHPSLSVFNKLDIITLRNLHIGYFSYHKRYRVFRKYALPWDPLRWNVIKINVKNIQLYENFLKLSSCNIRAYYFFSFLFLIIIKMIKIIACFKLYILTYSLMWVKNISLD